MYKKVKAISWLLLIVFALSNGSTGLVIQEHKYVVDNNRDIPSKENLIANVSAKSKLQCVSWCMTEDDCCSCVYDKTTGTCGLYSCCSPTTTVTLHQDVLKKQMTPDAACIGLKNRCPVLQGYHYDADLCICLKFIATDVSHGAAVNECAADCGKLVKIDSPSQQQKVESFLATIPGINNVQFVWIQGGNSAGVYRYDEGTEMIYFNWDRGEPSESNEGEPYIFMKVAAQYKWHDAQTYYTASGLCQII